MFNSNNQIVDTNQSAGNPLAGSSETIRKLSVKEREWLAGIIDGDGNLDIQNLKNYNIKRTLKQIRITQHPRDSKILYKVKDLLGGKIRSKGKLYIIWTISTKELMTNCLNELNGHIRLKVESFKEACKLSNITYIESNYTVEPDSAYLSGLIDTDGSIVFNSSGNKIDVVLEFQENEYSSKLDLSKVIPDTKVTVYRLQKRNQTADKIFYSIRFTYQGVDNMLPLYQYFLQNRLYSDFKFYRAMKIKRFLELRCFYKYAKDSPEYKLYIDFLKDFFTHMNEQKSLPPYLTNKLQIMI